MSRRNRRRNAFANGPTIRLVATLDLHGFRASEVPVALETFLTSWRRRAKGGVVHIITGKGRGSSGHPVLRPRVRRLLAEDYSDRIDWVEPDHSEGGFLVKLK
jgi:DNA-nicking Smr family endonuclease